MKNKYNSHVQINQGLLKGFNIRGKKGFVFYLDLESEEIKTAKIRNLGTIENYFNKNIESLLGESETNFGDTYTEIKNNHKNKIKLAKLSEEDTQNIINFYKLQKFRSEKMVDYINENSIAVKLSEKINQNNFIIWGKNYEINDLCPRILINNSEKGFLTLRNAYYYFEKNNFKHEVVVIPLNPEIAIVLVNKEDASTDIIYWEINDSKVVVWLNYFAYLTELNANNKFLVGKKEDLENLLKLVVSNKGILKK